MSSHLVPLYARALESQEPLVQEACLRVLLVSRGRQLAAGGVLLAGEGQGWGRAVRGDTERSCELQ